MQPRPKALTPPKNFYIKKQSPTIRIRKLTSLYATTEKGKLDFQWPSEDQAQVLFESGERVTLHKLEIVHSDSGAISGLRMTLSNGAMSPLFLGKNTRGKDEPENKEVSKYARKTKVGQGSVNKGTETLIFDQCKRIQKLALRVGSTVAYGMEFYDKDNKELAGWCDFSHNKLRSKF